MSETPERKIPAWYAKARAQEQLEERAPSMLALLEKALPIVEEEAGRRDMADGDNPADSYWSEMRELANEIAAEIARARKAAPK